MKYIRSLSSLLAIVLILSSCEQTPEPELKFTLDTKSAKLISTNNDFGFSLMKKVMESEEKANLMISPSSVSMALGMTYNGAESATAEAFEKVLNYEGLSREEINGITRELIDVLTTNSSGNQLDIANSLWADEGFPFHEAFMSLNRDFFDAEVREIDLQGPDAIAVINDWVLTKTGGKIEEMVRSIDPTAAMILLNALYFKCSWEVEFDKNDTYDGSFYREDGTVSEVRMMSLESDLRAAFTEKFSAVELPYKNGKFSMYLFLPTQTSTPARLLEELDGESWASRLAEFNEVKGLMLSLPKFKFDYRRNLNSDLQDLGLGIAFSPAEADFSSMSPVSLWIDKVIHQSFIEVNEEGTEAAASTAVHMKWESASPGIHFDRPFLFAITENSSGAIVFLGKVGDPAAN